MKRKRNMIVWAVTVCVALALWWIAARAGLHFTRPLLFLTWVAIAAVILTGLLWWNILAGAGEETQPDNKEES